MIKHRLTPDGAFIAGDTKTGRTAYAYPTSLHATDAKRRPEEVAAEMMAAQNRLTGRDTVTGVSAYDARHWDALGGRS